MTTVTQSQIKAADTRLDNAFKSGDADAIVSLGYAIQTVKAAIASGQVQVTP